VRFARNAAFLCLTARPKASASAAFLNLVSWIRLRRKKTRPPSNRPEPLSDFGSYHVIGVLGEGGMGIVYLAEQREPIRRRVALKVLKHGDGGSSVTARFESESQALALMDHPNIAGVYDAGTTSNGRPYFAMEYVPGIPITDYCDRNLLGFRDRLVLFQQVCQAVQHAHQKGIIHRDLKPSNVLVMLQDGKPKSSISESPKQSTSASWREPFSLKSGC
jgi:serine/threonine protein kinase